MISHLRGPVEKKSNGSVVIDANGVGYEVFVPVSTGLALHKNSGEVKLYIVESSAMYGGGTTLYGFLTEEEKDVFMLLRNEVPGAGAKKALEYMDKVTKSIADFRKAIVNRDVSLLTSLFGFTKKTAEKLVAALKDKAGELNITGKERFHAVSGTGARAEAIAGLIALGYRETQAREAVDAALNGTEKKLTVEEIIKLSLQHL
ncbi:MAG: Holliday junction branch migration protein RuvA [Elusimicrobiota bacterium]